jgi:4-diphosphocytidyl-2-C-methyl-D-erythritol kinase
VSETAGATDACVIHAPAKLNLGLRIIGRRPDGFHELETTFVAVDLYDELHVRRNARHGLNLTCDSDDSGPALDLGESNLIMRAFRLVERASGVTLDLDCRLVKRIPIAAGLGGGSADAAGALVAADRLYGLATLPEQMADWAAQLGSDVPFFLGPPVARGTGRGEVLMPATVFSAWWAVLISPRTTLSTAAVYAALDLTSAARSAHVSMCADGDGFWAALGRIQNDLESVVVRRVPEVSYWREQLIGVGARGVSVSGSGPTVFGVFAAPPDLEAVARWRGQGTRVFVVRPVRTPRALVVT